MEITSKNVSSQFLPETIALAGKSILGEVAFQLERRILDYVFINSLPAAELPNSSGAARKRRFYGYTVNNIGEMINREVRTILGRFDLVTVS